MYISKVLKIVYKIWALNLMVFLKKSGLNNFISPLTQIIGLRNITIGSNLRIASYSRIESPNGKVSLGNNNQIHRFSQIIPQGGTIKIGSFCSINPFVNIYGPGDVTIGSYVRIANSASIFAGNHVYEDSSKMIHDQGMRSKGIIIEDDVWIGTQAVICDGVVIAKGCVIGANSVVTKSTKPYEIYVGIPAKSIGKRS